MGGKVYLPICGYKTLDDEHEYGICPICFWEDDYLQFDDVDREGGANHISLRQAQKNYFEFGACEIEMLKHVRKPTIDDVRDINRKALSKECDKVF